jgi:WD40 repeat protein
LGCAIHTWPDYTFPKSDSVSAVGFNSDALRVLIVTGETAQVWDPVKEFAISEPMTAGEPIMAAKFNITGDSVITVSEKGLVETWDARQRPAGLVVFTDDVAEPASFGSESVPNVEDKDSRVAFGIVAGAVKSHSNEKAWQIHFSTLDKKSFGTPIQGLDELLDFQFYQSGRTIATATKRSSLRGKEPDPGTPQTCAVQTWDVNTGKLLGESISVESLVPRVSLSPDGRHAVISTGKEERLNGSSGIAISLQIWDVATGTKVGTPVKADYCLGFEPAGQRMVVKWRSTADSLDRDVGQIWDVSTGNPIGQPMDSRGSIDSAVFSPNGKLLALLSKETVEVWETQNGLPISGKLDIDRSVHAVEFSRDGKWLIGTGDRIYLWDVSLTPSTAPDWLADLAEVVGGEHLNAAGAFEPVNKTLSQLQSFLRQISGNDAFSQFARWFVSDPEKRAISPSFKIAAKDFATRRLNQAASNTVDQKSLITEAYFVHPDVVTLASLARFMDNQPRMVEMTQPVNSA